MKGAAPVAIQYNDIPTLEQWKRDSSVTLATRANDTVLVRIDELVNAVGRAPDDGARTYIVSDLFFTLDYWLKVYKTGRGMEKGREPAIMALYKCVVDELGSPSVRSSTAEAGSLPTISPLPSRCSLAVPSADMGRSSICGAIALIT